MSRYGVRGEYDWDAPLLPSLDAPESQPINTGIVDRHGRPILRLPQPVGFHTPQGRR